MTFDIDILSKELLQACPNAIFALLHGSAMNGKVAAGSDIDIALYLKNKPELDSYLQAVEAVEKACPSARADIGILNSADPIYRFEALKGTLLFNHDQETYLHFFSLTCREYESQLADYQRQHKYRIEAASPLRK